MPVDRLWDEHVGAWFSAGQRVAIYLASGVKLKGIMEAYDSNGILLPDEEGGIQLVNRDSIATIMPILGGDVENMGRAR